MLRLSTLLRRPGALLPLLVLAPAFGAPSPQGEFSASGQGVLRIESELKLTVPDADVEPLWTWLRGRYADLAWLPVEGRELSVSWGDERFLDTYFDDAEMTVLGRKGGVRHRRRAVLSGAATAKDGRQLLQIKLATEDSAGIARGEVKYVVDPPSSLRDAGDVHPMLALIHRAQRPEVIAKFAEVGLDAWQMRPVLTVQQVRRRVYLADQGGALATLTLDECSCDDFGASLAWTEIELELNEIRYTEADAAERAELEGIVGRVEQDILQRFPDIRRDQTPKYVKAFVALERESLLPVGWLVRAGLDERDTVVGAVALALTLALVAATVVARRRRLALEQAPAA